MPLPSHKTFQVVQQSPWMMNTRCNPSAYSDFSCHMPHFTGGVMAEGVSDWSSTSRTIQKVINNMKLRKTVKLKFITQQCDVGTTSPLACDCRQTTTLNAAKPATPHCQIIVTRSTWWWKQCAPRKRRSTATRLHGAESQNAVIFKNLI
jgi:hypothetical protein